ncbi:MAG: hypothetical protein LUD78_05620 [Clostridiales bacterium]|nr:hypothetical protein [Clostridiales bacterium]
MENEKLTMKQDRADKHPDQQEATVRQLQAVRMNRYAKNLNALLKGKEQNASE